MAHISVVIPVYKAEKCLNELYRRLISSLEKITPYFEIILVEDCGGDASWDIITALAQTDPQVKGIQFSRNFGQHYGITAGLDFCNGDWVVVMDCDLQDQPEEIVKLYQKAQQGYDIVFGRRFKRKDNFFKQSTSFLFNKLFEYLTDSKIDNTVSNFSISKRYVIENFKRFREHNRSFPLFINWMGFNKAFVDIEHAKRFTGKSSYTLRKLFNFAIDSIVAHSNKPLRISIKFGFLISSLSFIAAVDLIIRYFVLSIKVEGWTSLMVSIFFVSGLLFANMGLLGLYIGKIFDETKNRPLYIIKETTGVIDTKATRQ